MSLSNTLHGILLLNKPEGLTSQQAVSRVKRLFNVKKAGHTGSLDPLATGLLPICIGEATKFTQLLLTSDKHYQVRVKLGQRTDTGDSEGNIIDQKSSDSIDQQTVQDNLKHFVGDIFQIPPMFSAVKHQGKPLYHFARKGIDVKRHARPVTIYELKLLDYHKDQFDLEVRCSKGTYIRTLVDDLGLKLNCFAHVTRLNRLSVGKYSLANSIDFPSLESMSTFEKRKETVLSIAELLPESWPSFHISEAAVFYLQRGQFLTLPNIPCEGHVKLLLKSNHQLIGIGRVLKDGRLAPHRLLTDHPAN